MALAWERHAHGAHYEVRTAGRTVRLYTNGVLHTQYNPSRLATGSVWDLLLLGALLQPMARMRRVLVLGVGGGAVLRQLLSLFPGVYITGVELNPVHLAVGRRFFGLDDPRVGLVRDDAVCWLSMYDGEPFDVIVDDLFSDAGGTPARAVPADADWLDLLSTHLAPGGTLVMNFADAREVRASDWSRGGPSSRRWPAALSLSHPTCENRVLGWRRESGSAAVLSARVAADPRLARAGLRWRARRVLPAALH